MVGNKNSGNPNIVQDTNPYKCGPNTPKGRLKQVIMSNKGIAKKETDLFKQFRRCDRCALGPNTRFVKGIKVTVEPLCKFYKKDAKKCYMPVENWGRALNAYYEVFEGENPEESVAQYIMGSALDDAVNTKPIEIMKKGHAAGYTEMHEQRALKAAEVLHKMKYGEKCQNLNVNVDLSHEIVEAFKKRVKEDKEVVEAEIQEQEAKK